MNLIKESRKNMRLAAKDYFGNLPVYDYVTSCGVYFIYCKSADEIVYVGQSKNVFSRMAQHRDRYPGAEIRYLLVEDEYRLSVVEAYYIWLFEPRDNVTVPTYSGFFAHSNNIDKIAIAAQINPDVIKVILRDSYLKDKRFFSIKELQDIECEMHPKHTQLISNQNQYK